VRFKDEEYSSLSSPEEAVVSIVLFMGKDCAPCKIVKKHLDKIIQTAGEHVNFVMIDTEKHTALRDKYGIINVPEVLIDNKTVLSATQPSELLGAYGTTDSVSGMMGFGDATDTLNESSGAIPLDSMTNADQGISLVSMFAGSGAEVFNHLFNALIEARVTREERDLPANMKQNMLHISSCALRAIDEGETLRPSVVTTYTLGYFKQ